MRAEQSNRLCSVQGLWTPLVHQETECRLHFRSTVYGNPRYGGFSAYKNDTNSYKNGLVRRKRKL